jgi:hypothetical protein
MRDRDGYFMEVDQYPKWRSTVSRTRLTTKPEQLHRNPVFLAVCERTLRDSGLSLATALAALLP